MVNNKIEFSPKIKIIIVSVIFLFAFIILCVVYFINNNNNKTDTKNTDKSTTNSYVDPGSGETISDPLGKAKEKTDSMNSIAYLGFTNFLDHGMSYKQFLKLKSHFKQYAVAKKIDVKEVSVTLSTYKSLFSQGSDERLSTFEVTINRKLKYNAKVTYKGLDMPILYLYNQSDAKEIFKSYTGGN